MREIATFFTDSETCPYLHDRPARQKVRMAADISGEEYSQLLAAGWRRFGSFLFRSSCRGCQECVPIRVLVWSHRPTKSQRRVLRRNADVSVEIGEPVVDEERLELYRRFHRERSRTRGWPYRELDASEYGETFLQNAVRTLEFRYRLDRRLIGVAYVGEAADSLNSIYAFAEPELGRRGLGNFDILCELAAARELNKRYLYLGYLVSGCISMEYKAAFRPHELFRGGRWQPGDRTSSRDGENVAC